MGGGVKAYDLQGFESGGATARSTVYRAFDTLVAIGAQKVASMNAYVASSLSVSREKGFTASLVALAAAGVARAVEFEGARSAALEEPQPALSAPAGDRYFS